MRATYKWTPRLVSRGALIVSLAIVSALAGCGATAAATTTTQSATSASAPAATATTPANATTINITGAAGNYSFQPAHVTVKAGATVVWVNLSGVPHTSTSDSGSAVTWDSGTINTGGGSFSFVFSKPGTYPYHCSFHPFMHGTIVVTG